NGVCTGACDAGFADCNGNKQSDGCETNVSANAAACGACNGACSTNHIGAPACANGLCTGACDPGFADCNGSKHADGCETNVAADPAHCGACTTACSLPHAAAGCAAGACTIASCDAGYADCDGSAANGCETNIAADVARCGNCATAC